MWFKSGTTINVDVSVKIKKRIVSAKPGTFACETRKYLRSIIDDSVVTCNDTINAADIVSTNVTSDISKNSYNKKA